MDKKSQRSLPFDSLEKILQGLQTSYGEPVYSYDNSSNTSRLIGIDRPGAPITLEPAAQLEISIGPVHEVHEFRPAYEKFISLLSPILEEMDATLLCLGYHPRSKVDELPIIPKQRYAFMDKHFKTTGSRGKNMMKGSAATQVSIDYESEVDFTKKFRLANILGPLFALACDNTAIFEGEPFLRMARTYIWNDVDPARSMVVQGSLDAGGSFGFLAYAEYVYDTPPIIVMEGEECRYTGHKPASELFTARAITTQEIEHILGMVFPDVRLKTQIEIRVADSLPFERALSYTKMLKDIFYDSKKLECLYEKTLWIKNSDVTAAKEALIAGGAEAEVYGRRAADWLEEIGGPI